MLFKVPVEKLDFFKWKSETALSKNLNFFNLPVSKISGRITCIVIIVLNISKKVSTLVISFLVPL